MKILILLAFIGIIVSLGSALVFIIKDQGKTNRPVYALATRVGLSLVLFLFILFAHYMGWIEPTGILYAK